MKKTILNELDSAQSGAAQAEEINVRVGKFPLTPLTCASVINEIIKCLIYQKSQVPYPYNWLKSVVNRRRRGAESGAKPLNFTVARHYEVVSTAFDALENITKNLNFEFKNYGDYIKQVLILFGSTVYSPKEVFRIQIEGVTRKHLEEVHLQTNHKNQHKVLREIVLSEEWINAMKTSIPLTNMYVMLQKFCDGDHISESSCFKLNMRYSMPVRTKTTVINLHYDDNVMIHNCCIDLSIYEDLSAEKIDGSSDCCKSNDRSEETDQNCDLLWFQGDTTVTGFKECFINNVCATELW